MAYYFPSSQPHALQYSRTLLQFVTKNLSTFANFDSQRFVAQFLIDFELAIEAAENVQDDEVFLAQQSIKTQAVKDIMAQARKQFQILKHFVQIAFPDDENVWEQFGLKEYSEVRTSAIKMIPFLYKIHQVASENRVALNKYNYLDVQIDAFNDLHQNLVFALNERDFLEKDRTVITKSRRKTLDFLFDNFVTPVREVGKLIFVEDEELYAYFLFPKRKNKKRVNNDAIVDNM